MRFIVTPRRFAFSKPPLCKWELNSPCEFVDTRFAAVAVAFSHENDGGIVLSFFSTTYNPSPDFVGSSLYTREPFTQILRSPVVFLRSSAKPLWNHAKRGATYRVVFGMQ